MPYDKIDVYPATYHVKAWRYNMFSFITYNYLFNGQEVEVKITPKQVLEWKLKDLEAQAESMNNVNIEELRAHWVAVDKKLRELD